MKKLNLFLIWVLMFSITCMGALAFCYQEFANSSYICGALTNGNAYTFNGTFDGGFPASQCFDGNWDTSCGNIGYGDEGYVYINYTKPMYATNESLWQVKSIVDTPGINLTIPSSCWESSNNSVYFQLLTKAGFGSSYYCWNSTGWSMLLSYGYTLRNIYEEAMWWDLSNNQTDCLDTDTYHVGNDSYSYPSINYTIGGTMSYSGQNYFDYCENYTTLREMYCQDSLTPVPQGTSYDCASQGMICQNGACYVGTNNSCTDTDTQAFPSVNYYIQGITTSVVNQVPSNSTDYCIDSNTLKEYYCQAFTNTTIFSLNYNCAVENKTCIGGVCVGDCSQPICQAPCVFYDNFNYQCSLMQSGWSLLPYNYGLSPTNGELCYQGNGTEMEFNKYLAPDSYADIMTEEFNLTMTNVSINNVLTSLAYYDSTDKNYKIIYFVNFYYDSGLGKIILSTIDPQYGYVDVGTDVMPIGVKNSIKIVHYNFNALGRTFFNTSSQRNEPIKPHTFAVIINNNANTSYFNIPQYEPLIGGNSNLVNKVTFDWTMNNCMDDLKVYDGTTFTQFDLSPPTSNASDIQGCFNTKNGQYECSVSGCQDCCETIYNGSFKATNLICVGGKLGGYGSIKLRDLILNNIITFIVLMLLLILFFPIGVRLLEIHNQGKR